MPTGKKEAPRHGDILLATIGARWHHTSLGLRLLAANMGDLAGRTRIVELDPACRPADAVERILADDPAIVGLGVHVWNADPMNAIAVRLKALRPDLPLVLGGPEVSFPDDWPPVARLADHVVLGEGEIVFADLCRALLCGERPAAIVDGGEADLARLALPYHLYTDEDIAHRTLYVEATRGCPGRCEFCLSSLSGKVRSFPVERVLAAIDELWARGARAFKFTDRALNHGRAAAVLEALLEKASDGLFVHFEIVPRRIPADLFSLLTRFPAGALQLEVGVQTLSDEIAARIGRRQSAGEVLEVVRRLVATTLAHVHADLVVGLPGETSAQIARGFDALFSTGAHEIQIGTLKRLRGAPIRRHTDEWAMIYSPDPPYEVLQTASIPFREMQRLKRFARYFDLVHNSGRFPAAGAMLLRAPSPFTAFMGFADWLFDRTGRTADIARERLARLVERYLVEVRGLDAVDVAAAIEADLIVEDRGALGTPSRQRRRLRRGGASNAPDAGDAGVRDSGRSSTRLATFRRPPPR